MTSTAETEEKQDTESTSGPATEGQRPMDGPEEQEPEDPELEDDDELDDAPDLSARELCIDGACIGVIGSDGRCRECGKIGAQDNDPDGATDSPNAVEAASDENRSWEDDVGPDDLDFGSRVLCSNGACVGVIGANNECKACGRPYSGEWHENEEVVPEPEPEPEPDPDPESADLEVADGEALKAAKGKGDEEKSAS